MHIVALDLGTKTGWATLYENRVEWGQRDFSQKREESRGMKYYWFEQWMETIALPKPDVLLYEQVNFYRGGAPTEVLVGLVTHVQKFCAVHDIEMCGVHNGTLKKFATGKGNAKKPDMIDAAFAFVSSAAHLDGMVVHMRREQTLEGITDNEADALNLLRYGIANFGGKK